MLNVRLFACLGHRLSIVVTRQARILAQSMVSSRRPQDPLLGINDAALASLCLGQFGVLCFEFGERLFSLPVPDALAGKD